MHLAVAVEQGLATGPRKAAFGLAVPNEIGAVEVVVEIEPGSAWGAYATEEVVVVAVLSVAGEPGAAFVFGDAEDLEDVGAGVGGVGDKGHGLHRCGTLGAGCAGDLQCKAEDEAVGL